MNRKKIVAVIVALSIATSVIINPIMAYSAENSKNEVTKSDKDIVHSENEIKDIKDIIQVDPESDKDYYLGDSFFVKVTMAYDGDYTIPANTKIRVYIPKEAIDYNNVQISPQNPAIEIRADEKDEYIEIKFNQDFEFRNKISLRIATSIGGSEGDYKILSKLIYADGNEVNLPLKDGAKDETLTVKKPTSGVAGIFDPFWDGDNYIGKGLLSNGEVGGIFNPSINEVGYKASFTPSMGTYDSVKLEMTMDYGQFLKMDSIKVIDEKTKKDITNSLNIIKSDKKLVINIGETSPDMKYKIYFKSTVNDYGKVYTTDFKATTNTGYTGGYPLKAGFANELAGAIPKINANNRTTYVNHPLDLMDGVTASDIEDGDLTDKVKVDDSKVNWGKHGTYEVSYMVRDSDYNAVIKNIEVVVLSNDAPIIEGNINKTIKVGQVDSFDPMKGIKATDTEDGDLTKEIKVDGIVGKPKAGTDDIYVLKYSVTDSDGNTTTVKREITVTNQLPKLHGINNLTITEGDTFYPMAGVTAEDTEDGNITKDIKVIGEVNTNKPGKYEITYEVTDSDGNKTMVKRIVTVNPKWSDLNSVPTINGAENKTIKVSDIFNPLDGITANDKEDGDITKNIKVIENTVDTSKTGTYKVVYEVTDSKGAKTTKTITIIVRSNDKPVISGADNCSIKEGDTFDPMAGVTAEDTEDGNITKDIKVIGEVNTNKPGKYEITYEVTDSDGNKTMVKRIVTVNLKWSDLNSAPTINGAENKTIKVSDIFNPLDGITANDKEDGDITKNIKVIENTVDTSKTGTYKVVYEVTDSKGAKTTKTITIIVRSNDKPIISGADNCSIKEGDTFDPMAGVTAEDTEDGNITKDIKVIGEVNTNKPGKYEITYEVTDSDSNKTMVKRIITVNPKSIEINNAPVINAKNKTLKVGEKFNPMDGVTAEDKEDGDITKNIKVIENTVDTSKAGTYKVVYEVIDSQGVKTIKEITVIVNNEEDNSTITNGKNNLPKTGYTAVMTVIGTITTGVGAAFLNKKSKR